MREKDKPRFFPSLGRSLSRRQKNPRPGLAGILSEQDPEQASNMSGSLTLGRSHNDENRPLTSSSALSFGSSFKRPPTSGSVVTNRSAPSPSPNLPVMVESQLGSISHARSGSALVSGESSVEQYKAALMRVEEENYKLLQENADLKRRVRECKCGGVARR